jgi:hypothetical protein
LENLRLQGKGERGEEVDAASGDEILLAHPPAGIGERGEIDRQCLFFVGGGGDRRKRLRDQRLKDEETKRQPRRSRDGSPRRPTDKETKRRDETDR